MNAAVLVRFKDGLEQIQQVDAPTDGDGRLYFPLEFTTGRPDRVENFLVRTTEDGMDARPYPIYFEADDPVAEVIPLRRPT